MYSQMDNSEQLQEVVPTPMVTFTQPDDPEGKLYLVLMSGENEEGNEFRDYEWITGRTAVYEFIKSIVLEERADLFQSKIIVETEPIEKAKTIIEFMRYVVDTGLIEDPGFDIMDYVQGDDETQF